MVRQYSDRARPLMGAPNARDVWKNRDFWPVSCFISDMSYTYNDQPIVYGLSNGAIFSDLLLLVCVCHFQWPWTTPNPVFKVVPFFDAEYLRNGARYRHNYSELLIGTYAVVTNDLSFSEAATVATHCKLCTVSNVMATYGEGRSLTR